MQTEHERGLITILFIFCIISGMFFYSDWKFEREIQREIQDERNRIENIQNKLASLSLSLKAVAVYDATTQNQIYGRNEEVSLPIASLIKTLTALTSLESNGAEAMITISGSSISQNGDFGLWVGEKWKIKDLIKLTMVSSANDGAFALSFDPTNLDDDLKTFPEADIVKKPEIIFDLKNNHKQKLANFLHLMEQTKEKIGIKNMNFYNVTGLDISETVAGARASATEVNKLNLYAFFSYPRIFRVSSLSEILLVSQSGFPHSIKNTNILIDEIPNLLFSKTGSTTLAGGNLSIIFKDERDHIIAVTALGSTISERFTDMEKIVKVLLE